MVLPELLGGVLAGNTLEDLLATRMLILLRLSVARPLCAKRQTHLELGQVVDILIDNDPKAVGLVVRRNVCLGVSA